MTRKSKAVKVPMTISDQMLDHILKAVNDSNVEQDEEQINKVLTKFHDMLVNEALLDIVRDPDIPVHCWWDSERDDLVWRLPQDPKQEERAQKSILN